MTRLATTAAALAALALVAAPTAADALDLGDGFAVGTYSARDPDTTNSHLVETPEGFLVIGAQRLFSEADRAIARVKRTGKPVLAIVVTVPHTDHFGGLARWRAHWPEAAVIAAPATRESMRTDGEGYIASRKAALGEDFPSQATVNANLPGTIVRDGDRLEIGGLAVSFANLPGNNGPVNTLVHLEDHGVLFTSEVVEDGITAFLKDADLDAWLDQLDGLAARFPDVRILYPAHGTPVDPGRLLKAQREHLALYRDGIDAALADDGRVDARETAALVDRIEATYPDYAAVARLPREELVALNIAWQAERRADAAD